MSITSIRVIRVIYITFYLHIDNHYFSKTFSHLRHFLFSDIFSSQILFTYCPDTAQILFRYCSDTVQILFRYCADNVQILFRYCSDTVQTSLIFQTNFVTLSLSKHFSLLSNIFSSQTSSLFIHVQFSELFSSYTSYHT